FALLAYMTLSSSSGVVFTWLSNFAATCGLVTWFGIGVTYLRFYKGYSTQGFERSKLPYTTRFQPYAAWWTVGASVFTLFFSAWEVFLRNNWSTATFVTNYFPIIFFPVLYVLAKLVMKVPIIKPSEMDFVSDIKEIDAITYDDPPPRNWAEAFWAWLASFFSSPLVNPTLPSDRCDHI
ncbi:hypothetical protein HYDPIDRAFT_91335, partial [Hydnomerulius pinastri MD-312]